MVKHYRYLVVLLVLFVFLPYFLEAEGLADGVVRPQVMQTVFSGIEEMHFTLSWTGGVKIGDLSLTLKRIGIDAFEIHARVTDYGLFKLFYPVDDTFTTLVRGAFKLPYQYDVLQKEGRGSVTRRLSKYDQENRKVTYKKNDAQELLFDITGPVYNEFSSFYITRSMVLEPGKPFIVPTFADEKRNAVKVEVKRREHIDSPFGRVETLVVMPLMKFKGLYDKEGDTIIWMTDDRCRVPVRIRSKILIGSLTANLDRYNNPACKHY